MNRCDRDMRGVGGGLAWDKTGAEQFQGERPCHVSGFEDPALGNGGQTLGRQSAVAPGRFLKDEFRYEKLKLATPGLPPLISYYGARRTR